MVELPPELPRLLFHRIVAAHARRSGNAVAIRQDGRRLDYAALDAAANRFAQDLLDRGIGDGARILFMGRNSDTVPVFALGANKAGVVPVPINWRLAPAEIRTIALDCSPAAIIAEVDFDEVAQSIAVDLPGGVPVLPARALLDGAAVVCAPVDRVDDPETVALQIYTSGTTGRPKGVMLSHRALLGINSLRHLVPWDGWGAHDVALVQAPLGHIGAFGMMTRALYFGATTVIHEGFGAQATLDAIARDRVSKLALVPTAIKMILDLPGARDADYSALDTVIYGSAPITPDLLRMAIDTFGCRFAQSYGMSETCGPTVALAPEDHHGARLSSVGRPLPGTQIDVVDEQDRALPPGETGEIRIRSIAAMSGYWGLPDETARTLDADGWVRTGDAGYIDSDGYLFLRGRVKEMIITGAENVYPAEVEAALCAHPDVGAAAVFGLPDAHWGEAVTAAIVPRPGAVIDVEGLRAWLRTQIAGYKVPKTVRMVVTLPLNAVGKVDKAALRADAR
ncbi:MAG: hypothetical protein RIS94_180 [Pseudomonadota bacterium]|jgi:acyl-CoA synthetase (AMP-forming)/AMP-acid ligase II